MTTTPKTAIKQLEALTEKREAAQTEVRKLKRGRDEYNNTTEAMRGALTSRRTSHSWEFEADGHTAKPDTETAELHEEVKARMGEPFPGEADLAKAIGEYQDAERAEHRFKLENMDALTAELTAPATAAVAQIEQGHHLIVEGTANYRAGAEALRSLIVGTPPLDGQALALDAAVDEWGKRSRAALDYQVMTPRVTDAGNYAIGRALAGFDLEKSNA